MRPIKNPQFIQADATLPETNENLLLVTRNGHIITGWMRSDGQFFGFTRTDQEDTVELDDVIAWMPLPDPWHEPKTKKGDQPAPVLQGYNVEVDGSDQGFMTVEQVTYLLGHGVTMELTPVYDERKWLVTTNVAGSLYVYLFTAQRVQDIRQMMTEDDSFLPIEAHNFRAVPYDADNEAKNYSPGIEFLGSIDDEDFDNLYSQEDNSY